MTTTEIALEARKVWPDAKLSVSRKDSRCDNCGHAIPKGDGYINPGEANPDRAGGFGCYRYCLYCGGGVVTRAVTA